MDTSSAHAPGHPTAPAPALGPQTFVRDAATGVAMSSEEWITTKVTAEHRTHEECTEELINAIARGDLIAIDPPG